MRLKLLAVLHRARNIIQPFEQTFLAHRMNVEAKRFTCWVDHRLRDQINADRRARMVTQLRASECVNGRVAASIPNSRNVAALAEPDLERYTIRLPA